jgi:hypothetical protein
MIIELPANAGTQLGSSTAQIISDLSSPISLIIGIALAFWIITMIIDSIRGNAVNKRADDAIADFEDYEHRHRI